MKRRNIETEIETVVFIPATPGGQLTKLMQEADDRFIVRKHIQLD